MRKKIYLLLSGLFLICVSPSFSQITLIGSFNPTNISTLCGIGYDPDSARVYVYGCSEAQFHKYDTSGILIQSYAIGGETANDVDLEIAPEEMQLHNSIIPKGEILFINGETGVSEIYAINQVTGNLTDTLSPQFGSSHVVGGAYHKLRNTMFLVQDNVPNAALKNLVAEINPVTGDTIQEFQVTNYINIFYGDLEAGDNGNLFIVSSDGDSVAEFSPTGIFIQKHVLPASVINLSGIALHCAANEAWVSGNDGTVYHLGNFPCNLTGIHEVNPQVTFENVFPNPFSSGFEFSLALLNPGHLKISLLNMLGETVNVIYEGKAASGLNQYSFSKQSGKGIYLLKAEMENFSVTKKVISIE